MLPFEDNTSERAIRDLDFTILIGSFARGSEGPDSDVDILRINHRRELDWDPMDNHPVSYIDYSWDVFFQLFRQGSLFLHHTFTEGVLLEGDQWVWQSLSAGFCVSDDFSKEVAEYVGLLEYIHSYPGYREAYFAYLSNIFKALKNIAIFRLGEARVYEFDKRAALVKYFAIAPAHIQLLIESNTVFEKGGTTSTASEQRIRDFAVTWDKLHMPGLVSELSVDH
jgi:hypothetical protein